MAEMDIYMRRRLVALGGLVLFFILFVLMVKSCGGDEEKAPLTPTAETGATGEGGATPLTEEEFITQADQICADANSAVGSLDPADPDAVADEADITAAEFASLSALVVESNDRALNRFNAAFQDLVDALESKAIATQRGNDVEAGEAQLAIDTAEIEARAQGENYGFNECGQFLDAGQGPGGGTAGAGAGTGTVTPPATGGTTPPTTATPPATDPPATDPPPDDSGGITP